jgi:cytochrome P450
VTIAAQDIYFDPWNRAIRDDPYPVYRALRDTSPLYYNEELDFYAVTRFDDVMRMLSDRDAFISGKGGVLEVLMAKVPIPPGLFIFEDPPFHTFHRARLSRVFTPRAVTRIEDDVRAFCATTVDSLVGRDRFDWMADLAREVPMRVMGLLLGIPEADQPMLRDHFIEAMHAESRDKPLTGNAYASAAFSDYIDWREDHPSDDLMTELLVTEFEDETGTTRRLRRDELLTYLNLIGAAGNDTTGLLIGWAGKILSDHPDQRREVAADLSLVSSTVEEMNRLEPPAYAFGRSVARPSEFHGTTVPEGASLLCLPGAANRDERQFGPDAESIDIHRTIERTLSFGYGPHFCLGANLARLEVRIVLEELLPRIPDWTVDESGAQLVYGGSTRGYDALPVVVG